MTSNLRLEILMQRAADGELSEEQRRELIQAVETHPDGWKQLACTFLEEQLVGHHIRRAPLTSVASEDNTVVQPVRQPKGFWYRHPALSTAVTICLAFVLGLSVPWERTPEQNRSNVAQLPSEPLDTSPVATDAELREQLAEILRQLEASPGRTAER